MKYNMKLSRNIALAIIMTLIVPVSVFAARDTDSRVTEKQTKRAERHEQKAEQKEQREQERTNQKSTAEKKQQGTGFCDKLSQVETEFLSKVTAKESQIQQKKSHIDQLTATDASVSGRTAIDDQLLQRIAVLRSSVQTPSQIAAVAEFESTVRSAIATRRAAVDTALQNFRASLNPVASIRTQAEAIFAQAHNDCESGVAGALVRTQVQSGLDALRSTMRAQSGQAGVVAALQASKKATLAASNQQFQTTITTASARLKAGLAK